MFFKQHTLMSSSQILVKMLKYTILFLFLQRSTVFSALQDHPRVLINRSMLERITQQVVMQDSARHDFLLFLNNKNYIVDSQPFKVTTQHLHRSLNSVMKNAFLYMAGKHDSRIRELSGYADDPNQYMQNIEERLLLLMHPDTLTKIRNMGQLQDPGYAAKSLSIAYDWGYDYFRNNNLISHAKINTALKDWKKWYTSPQRYYGSVFSNHAPWGAKSLAYIAAALGDDEMFYGTETKIQKSIVPLPEIQSLDAPVNISAKGYFEQILDAVNFVAYPRGGWHESVSYFLTKEVSELLEFAEVVCTYHNDPRYTIDTVYTSDIFKNAGRFLWHMTTPDGMYQKFGDTGAKTALPSEKYQPGGNTYGDINNAGAGYIGGYFLNRLYKRLRHAGEHESAHLVRHYIDEYCFAFNGPMPVVESDINLLYSLLWYDYAAAERVSSEQLEKNPLVANSIFFDRIGVLVSRSSRLKEPSTTTIRFDAQPFYFSGHQHFAAGNFTIFKGANLAIDGGRYTSFGTPETKWYYENVYRHAVSHNVVLIGDDLSGQKSFANQPNHAPYTQEQLEPFQEYGTGPDNVSVFQSDYSSTHWSCPWRLSGMRLQLANVYEHLGVSSYFRTLLHLNNSALPNPWQDFVLIFDAMQMTAPQTAHWQMHVRDNGHNRFYGDSVYVIDRRESFDPALVKADFGSQYRGQLLLKSLSTDVSPSVMKFDFPDSICQSCWNGRVWEESTHILRLTSTAKQEHAFLTVLAPMRLEELSKETVNKFSQGVKEYDEKNVFFKSLALQMPNMGEIETLYVNLRDPHQSEQDEYNIELSQIQQGWMLFAGLSSGEWLFAVRDQQGQLELAERSEATESDRANELGACAIEIPTTLAGSGPYYLSLKRL